MWKKTNKYCCEEFSIFHRQPKTGDCVRIFKYISIPPQILEIRYAEMDSGKQRFVKGSKTPYRFFLMTPLIPPNLTYSKPVRGLMLSYCPFCGVNLFEFYIIDRNIEEYVNEIEGETFN